MSIADELGKLGEMHQRGLLSTAEFVAAKARVIHATDPAGGQRAVAAVNGLRRSRDDRWLGGVCGGLAQATDLAPWLWRLGFALSVFFAGSGVLAYLLLWFFVPPEAQPFNGPRGQMQTG